jgi:serine/threonine protein kinase
MIARNRFGVRGLTDAGRPGPPEPTPTSVSDGGGPAGDSFEGYRLLQPFGKGGMGEVWKAERQALARMNHQSIAQVFGGMMTAAGWPNFAMEFVAITDYCERNLVCSRPGEAEARSLLEQATAIRIASVYPDTVELRIALTALGGR